MLNSAPQQIGVKYVRTDQAKKACLVSQYSIVVSSTGKNKLITQDQHFRNIKGIPSGMVSPKMEVIFINGTDI